MPSYERKKRIYWAATIAIIIMLVGLLGWYWFIKQQSAPTSAGGTDYSLLNATTDDLFGNGSFGSPLSVSGTNTATTSGNPSAPERAALVSITETPVAGFVPYDTSDGVPRVRYVERATGDVYEYNVTSKHSGRVLHATIPRTLDAVFVDSGKTVIRRYLDDAGVLTSVATPIGANPEAPGIEHTFLPSQVTALAAQGSDLALVRSSVGRTDVLVNDAESDTGTRTLFSSVLSGWLIDWQKGTILLTQHASNDLVGNAYAINPDTGEASSAMTGVRGLSTLLSPDATQILYSRATTEGVGLFVFDRATGISTLMPLATLAEKCAWSRVQQALLYCAAPKSFQGAVMPDDWYRGAVSFSDVLWRVDVKTASVSPVLDPETTQGRPVDVEHPTLNASESYLFFRNRTTQYLESFALPTYTENKPNTGDVSNQQTASPVGN